MLNPDYYTGLNKPLLIIRLVEVSTSLGELYTQRHTATIEHTKQTHSCYSRNSQESEAAKKRIAEMETYFLKEVVDDLDTQILCYQEERDMIKFLIGQLNGKQE